MAYKGEKRGAKPKVDEWLTDKGLTLLHGWARQGLSNTQIANNMGVHEATFYKWKSEHTEIYEAIKKGKEVVDFEVENALLKRALGYEYTETHTNMYGEETTIKKYMKPDTTAIIFWLKNRKPNEWRDRQNINHQGIINHNIDFSNITTDELRHIANGGGSDE